MDPYPKPARGRGLRRGRGSGAGGSRGRGAGRGQPGPRRGGRSHGSSSRATKSRISRDKDAAGTGALGSNCERYEESDGDGGSSSDGGVDFESAAASRVESHALDGEAVVTGEEDDAILRELTADFSKLGHVLAGVPQWVRLGMSTDVRIMLGSDLSEDIADLLQAEDARRDLDVIALAETPATCETKAPEPDGLTADAGEIAAFIAKAKGASHTTRQSGSGLSVRVPETRGPQLSKKSAKARKSVLDNDDDFDDWLDDD